MAVKREKIQIEVFGPISETATSLEKEGRADECVHRLARIIGRRIAREQFQQQHPVVARRLVETIT